MSKHIFTPGPWRIQFNNAGDMEIEPDICIVPSGDEMEAANACLIAASPMMLEALENALGAFNERECSCDFEDGPDGPRGRACYYHRIEQDIKDAIAKATGGAK
jgi:hypothetical protein